MPREIVKKVLYVEGYCHFRALRGDTPLMRRESSLPEIPPDTPPKEMRTSFTAWICQEKT